MIAKPEFRTCHTCKKEFLVALPTEWAYRTNHSPVKFFCSYSCSQKFKRAEEEKAMQRKDRYARYRRDKAKKGGEAVG